MAKSPRIYRNENIPHADIPNVDLLTLLFGMFQSLSQLKSNLKRPRTRHSTTGYSSSRRCSQSRKQIHQSISSKHLPTHSSWSPNSIQCRCIRTIQRCNHSHFLRSSPHSSSLSRCRLCRRNLLSRITMLYRCISRP